MTEMKWTIQCSYSHAIIAIFCELYHPAVCIYEQQRLVQIVTVFVVTDNTIHALFCLALEDN